MPGRLANRLFFFSHLAANAIEYDYKLFIPSFGPYSKLFYSTRNNDFSGYRISTRFRFPLPGFIIRSATRSLHYVLPRSRVHEFITADDTTFDLYDPLFINKALNNTVFLNGWLFRDYQNVKKHSETIREFFAPSAGIDGDNGRLLRSCREKADVVNGVHIRRGDYRRWCDGRYYYSNAVYADKLQQLDDYFISCRKSTVFLLCSDEMINVDEFGTVNIALGRGDVVTDLYAFASCDYLVGPPSSYSMWASYYGQVPLIKITDEAQRVTLQHAAIVEG